MIFKAAWIYGKKYCAYSTVIRTPSMLVFVYAVLLRFIAWTEVTCSTDGIKRSSLLFGKGRIFNHNAVGNDALLHQVMLEGGLI